MIRLKSDKRGTSLSLNKLIILILAALVIIGAFFVISIYGREILDWFKNQPDYPSYGEDEVVEGADESLGEGICEVKVAEISQGGKLWLYENGKKRSSELIISSDNKILNTQDIDDELGKLIKDTVKIENYDLVDTFPYISYEELKRLDGSKKLGNFLCKSEQEIGEDEQEVKEECPVKIADVSKGTSYGKVIRFCGDKECTEDNLIDSELFLYSGLTINPKIDDIVIKVRKHISLKWKIWDIVDYEAGEVNNKGIILKNEVLQNAGQDDLPSYELLSNLNGAYFRHNLICRDERIKPEKKQEIKDLDSAILQLSELIKRYGENAEYSDNKEIKNFVDEVYRLGLITKEELDEIDGKWGWGEESLDYVRNILEKQGQKEKKSKEVFPNIKRFTYNEKGYYINIDDFIKKKNSFNPPDRFSLYEDVHEKDGKLTLVSEDYLVKSGKNKYYLVVDEKQAYPVQIIDDEGYDYIDVSDYFDDLNDMKVEAESEEEKVLVGTHIANPESKLGVDTGGDAFAYIYFRWVNGVIYIRFADTDFFKITRDKSPWILIDYWNEYRTFKNAPDWALLEENN